MSRRVYIVKDNRSDGWWTLLLAVFILAFWQTILFSFIAGFVAVCIWYFIKYLIEQRDLRNINNANIALTADHENMLAIQGDPMGVYGRYTPATMPLTTPQMRGWK